MNQIDDQKFVLKVLVTAVVVSLTVTAAISYVVYSFYSL